LTVLPWSTLGMLHYSSTLLSIEAVRSHSSGARCSLGRAGAFFETVQVLDNVEPKPGSDDLVGFNMSS
jgi:hypothetical protein